MAAAVGIAEGTLLIAEINSDEGKEEKKKTLLVSLEDCSFCLPPDPCALKKYGLGAPGGRGCECFTASWMPNQETGIDYLGNYYRG